MLTLPTWRALGGLAQRARRPIEGFLRIEAASGIVLLVAAAVAFGWANSAWGQTYTDLWQYTVGFRLGPFDLARSLRFVVNDGLMVVFFFVVGLELRREAHRGELSDLRRAALPAFAALGGMITPAVIYLALAGGPATRSGWGVPMATDIAFAVGVLALLGKRVPPALRMLLLALAIIDDLGAIIVIAFFYSSGITPLGLLIVTGGVGAIVALRAMGVRHKAAYIVPAVVIWAGTYAAGIHPTIAGVVVALMTPVRAWAEPTAATGHTALSPSDTLIETLHPWVGFLIMPVFALANAGVRVDGVALDAAGMRVAIGVSIALVVGKPLGVLLFSELSLRSGLARLPAGIGRPALIVMGVVAGIGFTMALFVADLAFSAPTLLGAAKLGILAASVVAAGAGLLVGRALLRPTAAPDAGAPGV